MSELKLPEPLMVNKNVARVLDDLEKKGETIFAFSGENNIVTLFELYLIKKYQSKCIASNLGDENYATLQKIIGISINLKKSYTKLEVEQMKNHFKRITKKLVECIKKGENIILIPLNYQGKYTHANVLIYRKNLGQLEHFEPHGGNFLLDQSVQDISKSRMRMLTDIFNAELKQNNLPQVKYIEASQVCPYILGLQVFEDRSTLKKKSTLEPRGYCSAWSLFFSELCLKNPEMSSSTIMDNIYNYLTTKPSAEDYLKKVIRGYAGYIFETVNKYLEIFFKPKLTVVDLINIKHGHDSARMFVLYDAINVLVSIETEALLDPNFNLKNELRETNKKYRQRTRGMTKQEMRNERLRDNSFAFLYYKKRILQNYEEYTNYGKITEPLLVSPMEIREEEIVNPTVIHKRNPGEIIPKREKPKKRESIMTENDRILLGLVKTPNQPKSKKNLTIRKTSNSKTRRK